ncbi:type VII secretion system-associated protein [Kitasatospora sp. NPDC056446]|uniref:type VII secretion system-associated protein n=1 Tax=Kitasatospora sp. NPDC056446 TaxID=3345819 RepID=UPI0036C31D78
MTADTAGPAAAADVPVPEHVRETARLAPDHWIGVVDPAWADGSAPPEWAVAGHWRSDEAGATEEFRPNPDYRPSPRALGWAEPTDPVDEAVQLAATGYGPGQDVLDRLATARVAVPVTPGGEPLAAVDPAGGPVVLAFTAGGHWAAGGRLGHLVLDARELLERLPEGHGILLNPTAEAMLTVDPDALRATVEATPAAPEVPAPAVEAAEAETEAETDADAEADGADPDPAPAAEPAEPAEAADPAPAEAADVPPPVEAAVASAFAIPTVAGPAAP